MKITAEFPPIVEKCNKYPCVRLHDEQYRGEVSFKISFFLILREPLYIFLNIIFSGITNVRCQAIHTSKLSMQR